MSVCIHQRYRRTNGRTDHLTVAIPRFAVLRRDQQHRIILSEIRIERYLGRPVVSSASACM